jgi:hypothetical protein
MNKYKKVPPTSHSVSLTNNFKVPPTSHSVSLTNNFKEGAEEEADTHPVQEY